MLPILAFGKVVIVELLVKGSIRAVSGVLNWLRPSSPLHDTDNGKAKEEYTPTREDPEKTHVMT